MLSSVPTHIQLTEGFYPLASLLTGGAVFLFYMLLMRMKCKPRQAQQFIMAGMFLATASLFLQPTLVTTERHEAAPANLTEQSKPQIPYTRLGFPVFPKNRFKQTLGTTPAPPPATQSLQWNAAAIKRSWQQGLPTLFSWYVAGIIISMLYIALQLLYLIRIRHRATAIGQYEEAALYQTHYDTPFSFARSIFLPAHADEARMPFVLTHEISHIRHAHFYKLLLLQVLTALNWFNPFAHLLYRCIREQQEMETDRDVLDSGMDSEQYQIHLVLSCKERQAKVPVSTGYNHSMLNSRIIFMNKAIKNSNMRTALTAILVACVSLYGCMDTKREKQEVEDYPLQGCWSMQCIGDSAFRTVRSTEIAPHYKLIGKDHVLTVCVTGQKPPHLRFFAGKLTSFRQAGDTAVVEAGALCPVERTDSATFNLTWRDDAGESNLPGLWKTERWQRHTPTAEQQSLMQVPEECHKRADRLKGVWLMSAFRNNNTGEIVPTHNQQYKWYGNTHYITADVTLASDRESSELIFFSGNCGTFEYVDDNLVRENGGDCRLEWKGENTFGMTLMWDGVEFYEEWTRTELPEGLEEAWASVKP